MNQKELNEKLIETVGNRNLPLMKYLVEQGANIHYNNDEALRWASNNGYLEVVKYLVEQGVDIHAADDYALSNAVYGGHLEVLKYLVEQGADIHARNDWALKNASAKGHIEVIKYFLFDCKMKIKQVTKDWLLINNYKEALQMIEKRDLLFQLDKDIIQKDSIDNFSNKIKI